MCRLAQTNFSNPCSKLITNNVRFGYIRSKRSKRNIESILFVPVYFSIFHDENMLI